MEIASADVSQMVDYASIVERLNENECRGSWLLWVAGSITVLGVFLFSFGGLLFGSLVVAIAYVLRERLVAEAAVQFEYQLDQQASNRYRALQEATGRLARCQRLWRIDAFGQTTDWKRHGGASQILRRSAARVGVGCARSFTSNLEIHHLVAGKETVYFLPDMMLVKQGRRFGAVSYHSLHVAGSATHFNEDASVPGDAQVVSTTWRFVNKAGGPDRRFNNNYQIPVVVYGQVALISESGLRIAVMASCLAAAQAWEGALAMTKTAGATQMSYALASQA